MLKDKWYLSKFKNKYNQTRAIIKTNSQHNYYQIGVLLYLYFIFNFIPYNLLTLDELTVVKKSA